LAERPSVNPPINYDEYRRGNQGRYVRILTALAARDQERLPRERPWDAEEERLLIQLDRARRDRLIASGELVQVGPRHLRWRL
jgi:hypothetical protein